MNIEYGKGEGSCKEVVRYEVVRKLKSVLLVIFVQHKKKTLCGSPKL